MDLLIAGGPRFNRIFVGAGIQPKSWKDHRGIPLISQINTQYLSPWNLSCLSPSGVKNGYRPIPAKLQTEVRMESRSPVLCAAARRWRRHQARSGCGTCHCGGSNRKTAVHRAKTFKLKVQKSGPGRLKPDYVYENSGTATTRQRSFWLSFEPGQYVFPPNRPQNSDERRGRFADTRTRASPQESGLNDCADPRTTCWAHAIYADFRKVLLQLMFCHGMKITHVGLTLAGMSPADSEGRVFEI